jgi:DNA-binding ferritin-like protein (Dps family)
MKMPRNAEARQILIRKLRKGVHAQIELWDMASSIAETLHVDLERILDFFQATTIHATTGMELGGEDLQDLLDLLMGKPSDKVWVGKPLVTIN